MILSFLSEVGYCLIESLVWLSCNCYFTGLHYDVTKGLFLKIDSSCQIQLGTVYRGKQKLEDEEVLHLYKKRQLSVNTLGLELLSES